MLEVSRKNLSDNVTWPALFIVVVVAAATACWTCTYIQYDVCMYFVPVEYVCTYTILDSAGSFQSRGDLFTFCLSFFLCLVRICGEQQACRGRGSFLGFNISKFIITGKVV